MPLAALIAESLNGGAAPPPPEPSGGGGGKVKVTWRPTPTRHRVDVTISGLTSKARAGILVGYRATEAGATTATEAVAHLADGPSGAKPAPSRSTGNARVAIRSSSNDDNELLALMGAWFFGGEQ